MQTSCITSRPREAGQGPSLETAGVIYHITLGLALQTCARLLPPDADFICDDPGCAVGCAMGKIIAVLLVWAMT